MSTPVVTSPARSGLNFALGPIAVEIPWSGLFGVALIAFLWAPAFRGSDNATVLAVVFALLLYVSILVHELAHAGVAMALGNQVDRVVLWVLGGFTSYRRSRESAWGEGAIAAAGPVTSAAIGFACVAVARSIQGPSGDVIDAVGYANIILAIYNSLPGLPLDGGAVLKSMIWATTGKERTGTLVAGWSGRIVAVLVVALPVVLSLRAGGRPSLTSFVFGLFIGGYLLQGANAALKRAQWESVASTLGAGTLSRAAVAVPLGMALAQADLIANRAGAGRLIGLDDSGTPRAIDVPAAREAVPDSRRAAITVADICAPLATTTTIPSDLSGQDLLNALAADTVAEYLVVDPDGQPIAILRLADVEAALTKK